MPYKLTFEDGSSVYLEHHGVKGMHWGVWNDETRARRMGSHGKPKAKNAEEKAFLSDRQKQNLKLGAAAVGGVLAVAGGVYLAKKGTGTWYGVATMSQRPLKEFVDKMDDEPVSLNAGSKLQRISGSRVEDFAKKGELYVSYKIGDNAKYADRLPNERWLRNKDVYKQTWKAASEIKAPSRKEAAEIYIKVAGDDARQIDFMRFMSEGIRKRTAHEERDAFLAELKARGYNAVIDENDANWTNKPLILIDPGNTVDLKRSRKLNAFDKVVAVYLR